jgi:uncharacterized membrane protein
MTAYENVTDWLVAAAGVAAIAIDVMAVILIVVGTAEAFSRGLRVMLGPGNGHERRDIWLRLDRRLISGLTFLLAADIIRTTIAPSWEDIGRVAAIAAIRTFLNVFLERDIAALTRRQKAAAGPPEPGP